MTPEQRRECGRKGAEKSNEVRRARRAMKETLGAILNAPMDNGTLVDIEQIKNLAALKGKNITAQEAMLLAMVRNAIRGDVRAAEFVRDTIGEKPKNDVDLSVAIPVVIGGEDELTDDACNTGQPS